MRLFRLHGEPLEYGPFTTGAGEDAVNHPSQVLDLWTDEELAAIGVERVPEPPPEPARLKVRKSTVINRLIAADKIAAAMAALMASPAAFGRWTAPDWPEVYCDDPEVLALLTAIDAAPDEILSPE